MLAALEVILAILVVAFVSTQIVLPLWKGTKLFPSWRRKQLVAELTDVNESVDRAELELELQARKKQAEALRRKAAGE
jgi:hypothetical protein